MTALTTPLDRTHAQEVADALARQPGEAVVVIDGQKFLLPPEAAAVLAVATKEIAAGRAVEVVPSDKLLTTGQAARHLGLSRTYMVTLLERNELPSERPGTHRRVKLSDVLEYKERRRQRRRAGLGSLAKLDEELGLNE